MKENLTYCHYLKWPELFRNSDTTQRESGEDSSHNALLHHASATELYVYMESGLQLKKCNQTWSNFESIPVVSFYSRARATRTRPRRLNTRHHKIFKFHRVAQQITEFLKEVVLNFP